MLLVYEANIYRGTCSAAITNVYLRTRTYPTYPIYTSIE